MPGQGRKLVEDFPDGGGPPPAGTSGRREHHEKSPAFAGGIEEVEELGEIGFSSEAFQRRLAGRDLPGSVLEIGDSSGTGDDDDARRNECGLRQGPQLLHASTPSALWSITHPQPLRRLSPRNRSRSLPVREKDPRSLRLPVSIGCGRSYLTP